MTQTNWLPGILVLAGSLLLGAVFLFLLKRKQPIAPAGAEVVADQDRQAQFLLDQLNELMVDKHQLSGAEFVRRKEQLERQAAEALRARQKPKASEQPKQTAPSAPRGFWARHPQLIGAFWGGGIVVFLAGLGVILTQNQRPRGDGEATGRRPPMSNAPGAEPEEDPSFKEAFERVMANPSEVGTAAAVAHELIRRQKWDEAETLTERALGVDPFSIENRIHRAALKVARGKTDQAIRELEHLANAYPDSSEALLFLGGLMIENQNQARALEYFERYATEAPRQEQPPGLQHMIDNLRRGLKAP